MASIQVARLLLVMLMAGTALSLRNKLPEEVMKASTESPIFIVYPRIFGSNTASMADLIEYINIQNEEISALKTTIETLTRAAAETEVSDTNKADERCSARCGPRQSDIAFSVGLTFDVSTGVSEPIRVPYDYVFLNHGDAFDIDNHVFVAPIRGLYSIHVSMGPIAQCMVVLVVNGEYRVMAGDQATHHLSYSGDSVTVILFMEVGDAAWVVMENGQLHSGGHHDPYYPYVPRNTFSGYLYAEV